MMNTILVRQGRNAVSDETVELRQIGFRSLDFSELALRVEAEAGRDLNFDASVLRNIRTVDDVLNFLVKSSNAS
jgi:acyl carrier protein